MPSTTETREQSLQVRALDPVVHRGMRIECASLGIPLAELIERMWAAYRAEQKLARRAG
jgi:hypothetical protein